MQFSQYEFIWNSCYCIDSPSHRFVVYELLRYIGLYPEHYFNTLYASLDYYKLVWTMLS